MAYLIETQILVTHNNELSDILDNLEWVDGVVDLDKVHHLYKTTIDGYEGHYTNLIDEYGETIFTINSDFNEIKKHFIKAKTVIEVFKFN